MQYLVQPLAPHSANSPLLSGNESRVFAISSAQSGLALTAVGRYVQLQPQNWQENTNQQWKVVTNGDGTYRIVNVGTGQVFDVSGAGGEGTAVLAWDWSGAANQRWRLSEANASGQFRLDVVHNGLSLNVFDSSAVVTIYQDSNYSGASQTLGVGTYDMGQLSLGNDQLSSLKVPAGLRVTLFEHAGFGGQQWVFTADSSFVGSTINDKTSSIKIEKTAPDVSIARWTGSATQLWVFSEVRPKSVIYQPKAIIYQHANYGGASQAFGVGSYDIGDLSFGNDQVSSLKVPAGVRVTLFEHANFRGNKWVFTADTSYVGDTINDKTSGVMVEKIATFYMDANYQGSSVILGVGRYSMAAIGLPNDNISSLKVPQGLIVTIYEHADFQGNFRTYYEDCSFVGADFNDKTSSIIIKQIGVIVPEKVLRFGNSIQLKTCYGKWITAKTDGSVSANSTSAGSTETFSLVRSGTTTDNSLISFGDIVSLKTTGAKYLSALSNGDVNAQASAIGDAERWVVVRAGATASNSFLAIDDNIALRSLSFNRYLVAETSGDANANRTAVTASETFTVTGVASDTSTDEGGSGGSGACGAEACGVDLCGADYCGADACG
ncbi:MAG: RICIN domain-containing protein, partial [Methylococcaceae bacterium]